MEIKPFKKIDGNGYSFKEIWKIYDEQFNILRDIVLSLGDKYQVDNVSGSDDKIITLDIPYNSNQVFVYFNGVLQWKDRDYRENSPTEIELLFDRKATDDLRIVTIKSNVIKEDLHQYLHDIDIVVRNAKEQYDSARGLESRLVELYSALQQTHSLYTNNSTTSLVNDLTRLKSEYEKVSEGVKALDIKLKDLISSSEYVLATLNLDSLKELVNSIKENLDELSREKSLDIVYPMYGSKQDGDDASVNDVGECTFVGIDKKHWFMIDTFSKSVGDGGYYSIKRAMSANKITKFEFLLITHWHEDHYGNAIRLIKEGLVEKVYVQDVTKYPSGISGIYGMSFSDLKRVYDEHKTASGQKNIPFETAPSGVVDFHGAKLMFHNNDDTAIAKHNSSWVNGNYNNTSICLLVSYIGRNFLAQGDGDKEVMKEYLYILPSNIDLLKSNHHSMASMPLSFRKLNPRDAVITANKYQLSSSTPMFNYQSYLFDMGSNVYFLANQSEDIHITYSSLYWNVEYNKNIVIGHPDNCAFLSGESGGHIFVDCNYRGNESTGDKDKPFKYLEDAVRMAHMNYMKEIHVNIAPGDYTKGVNNYNFANINTLKMINLLFLGLRGRVRFVNTGNSSATLPTVYISNSDFVIFENITFKDGDMYTSDVVSSLGSYGSALITNSTVNFIKCNFIISNNEIVNKEKSNSNFNTTHVDAFSSKVKLDSCTLSGKARFGIRSAEGSIVNVVNTMTVDDSVKTVYYATDGDITVNGVSTKNTSNESTGGGEVRFQDVATTPTYDKTTRGQVIGTRLSKKYGGQLGYISDGNGGYASIDHFNKSGNLNNKPNFEGQFAYDKLSKKIGFALGSANQSDWLELASKADVKSSTGVKEWRIGEIYRYGDLIKTSNGKTFLNISEGSFQYSSNSVLDSFNGNPLDIVQYGSYKLVALDTTDRGSYMMSLLHNRPNNMQLPSTNAEMNKLGIFASYYSNNVFKNQPTRYGQLINLPCSMDNSAESMQLWIEQYSGQIYTRGGNNENVIADTKFQPVYPNNFEDVDVLWHQFIADFSDMGEKRLKAPLSEYKKMYLVLTGDESNEYLEFNSFDIGILRKMSYGNVANKYYNGTNFIKLSTGNYWWGLKLGATFSSTRMRDVFADAENCRLLSVMGWPRIHGYDA